MRHETPDRVPVMCQLALGHYFLNSSQRPSEIWFDSVVFAQTLAEFQRRYGFDGLLINLPGRPQEWRNWIDVYERTTEGERIGWRSGMESRLPPNDNPHTFLAGERPLPRADVETVVPDDPATYHLPGYVWNTWHAPTLWDIAADADLGDPGSYPRWLTRGLRAARAACPDVSVHMEVFSPFTHLLELFGYEAALVALIDGPELCHDLLGRFARMVMAQVDCFGPCDPDAILISSAFAGACFISRAMYSEFVVPYERAIVGAVHAYGLPAYVHTCGAIGDRLDLMAGSGVDGIDTLDPPPLGTVDLARAKAEFGHRFFFKGNLDAVNEMLLGDDVTFETAVRRRLEVGMPGSGFILSSACSVAPHVKPQRLIRMVELADQYGRYA
ncbi:MAG: hypothetical protein AMXMBFR13_21120 [Phycisphaerae bacterium]